MTGLILDSENTILLARPRQACASSDCEPVEGVLSVMYITKVVGSSFFRVCFGKVKSHARPDQLITFTRYLRETLPIEYRDLPSAARNQTGAFQLPGSIRDGWPLDTQHFGQQVLSDRQCVLVAAVTHHEQPTRQPLLEAVRTVARS